MSAQRQMHGLDPPEVIRDHLTRRAFPNPTHLHKSSQFMRRIRDARVRRRRAVDRTGRLIRYPEAQQQHRVSRHARNLSVSVVADGATPCCAIYRPTVSRLIISCSLSDLWRLGVDGLAAASLATANLLSIFFCNRYCSCSWSLFSAPLV